MNSFKNPLLPLDFLLVSQHNMETCRRLASTFASLRLCGATLLGFHFLVLGSSFRGRSRSGPTPVEALPREPARLHKMTKQLLMCIFGPPNFKHEQSNPNSTKTPQREGKLMNMCEGRKRANLVPPLLCTTLRLGATGLGLGLSLLRGCSHSKKTVVFHSQLTRVSAGTMGTH